MLNLDDYKTSGKWFVDYIGLELKEVDKGRAVVEVQLEDKHKNREEIAHGGLIFTLCDMAAGIAAGADEKGWRRLVTQNASIYYLSPGRGRYLRAVGTVVREGRSTALSEVHVYDENNTLIAKGEFSEYFLHG